MDADLARAADDESLQLLLTASDPANIADGLLGRHYCWTDTGSFGEQQGRGMGVYACDESSSTGRFELAGTPTTYDRDRVMSFHIVRRPQKS